MSSKNLLPKLFLSFSEPQDTLAYFTLADQQAHHLGDYASFVQALKSEVLPKLLDEQVMNEEPGKILSGKCLYFDNPYSQPLTMSLGVYSMREMVAADGSMEDVIDWCEYQTRTSVMANTCEDVKSSFKLHDSQAKAFDVLLTRVTSAFKILGLLLENRPSLRLWQHEKEKTFYYCLRYAAFVSVPNQELPKPVLVDVAIRTC